MAMVQGSLSKAAFMRFRVLIAIVALISSPIEGYISPHISTVRVRSHHQVCDPFYPKRPAISPRSVLEDQSRLLPKLRISKTAMTIGESLPILSTLTQLWQQGLAINSVLALILATRGTNRSLTSQGLLHAYALGVGLWSLIGFEAWVIGVAYFILGSVVTKIKMKEKEGMICAILSYVWPAYSNVLRLAFVASMATKLSDTFGSEIGKAYGKTTYLVTTFQRVPRGTEGAVSLEGTLAGIAGSLLLTLLGVSLNLLSVDGIIPCLIAAFVANFAESYIGAVAQDKISWLSNELVNFINTSIGAVVAIALVLLPELLHKSF